MSYRAQIEDALAGHGADYCEIRIEESDSTRLTYRGRTLDDINMTSAKGRCSARLRERFLGFCELQRTCRPEEPRGRCRRTGS